MTCWIAPRDVLPGADWGESIIHAIESSRIMILIFSQNANASPQIKREVERAVNKGVYIIPFRVEDIPPARALEYFISTSQWMDAFSPPLERHLDILTKTVKAVLKSPPPLDVNVSAQSEKKSPMPMAQLSRPPAPKLSLIVGSVALAMMVGGAAWYLGHKRPAPPEKSSGPAQSGRQVASVNSTDDEAASKKLEPIAEQPQSKIAKNLTVLPAKDVANRSQVKIAPPDGPWPQAIPKIDGIWHDSDYLAVSQITQHGNSFRFTRQGTLANGTRFESSGSGTISGQRFTSTYYARYQTGETSQGNCSGFISGDGMHIELNCSDSLFGAFAGAENQE